MCGRGLFGYLEAGGQGLNFAKNLWTVEGVKGLMTLTVTCFLQFSSPLNSLLAFFAGWTNKNDTPTHVCRYSEHKMALVQENVHLQGLYLVEEQVSALNSLRLVT